MADKFTEEVRQRLEDADARRKRAHEPIVYYYIGSVDPGEIAAPPSRVNVRRKRSGDPKPEGALFYAPTVNGLVAEFSKRTKRTGYNVWRWKEKKS